MRLPLRSWTVTLFILAYEASYEPTNHAAYMDVANDLAVLEALRSSIVSNLWIGKGSSIEVINLQLNVKIFVGLKIISLPGTRDDRRHHIIKGWNVAHGCDISEVIPHARHSIYHTNWVARSIFILQAIRKGLAITDVNEINFITRQSQKRQTEMNIQAVLTYRIEIGQAQPLLPPCPGHRESLRSRYSSPRDKFLSHPAGERGLVLQCYYHLCCAITWGIMSRLHQ